MIETIKERLRALIGARDSDGWFYPSECDGLFEDRLGRLGVMQAAINIWIFSAILFVYFLARYGGSPWSALPFALLALFCGATVTIAYSLLCVFIGLLLRPRDAGPDSAMSEAWENLYSWLKTG